MPTPLAKPVEAHCETKREEKRNNTEQRKRVNGEQTQGGEESKTTRKEEKEHRRGKEGKQQNRKTTNSADPRPRNRPVRPTDRTGGRAGPDRHVGFLEEKEASCFA